MRLILVLISILLFNDTFCQSLRIKEISLENNSFKYSFPLIDTKSKIACKINDCIQMQSLYKKYSSNDEQILSEILTRKYIESSSFQVYTNNSHLLSIKINSGFVWHDNFNVQNGELIDLRNLFTSEGYEELIKKTQSILHTRVSDKLKSLKKRIRSSALDSLNTIFENYILDRNFSSFYIQNDSLTLPYLECSSITMLDGLSRKDNINWNVTFPKTELESLFSEFGKCVFNKSGNISNYYFHELYYLFLKGRIDNKYPITMFICFSYNKRFRIYDIDESGYWYNSVGKRIDLQGTKDGNSFKLQGNDDTSHEIETFQFTKKEEKYIGVWKNLKTNKELKFEAEEYK